MSKDASRGQHERRNKKQNHKLFAEHPQCSGIDIIYHAQLPELPLATHVEKKQTTLKKVIVWPEWLMINPMNFDRALEGAPTPAAKNQR